MNTPVDPTLGDAALRQAELGQQQQRMDALRRTLNNGAPQDKKAKLREACEGFEAIFIQRMWEQMQATVPKDGYLHSKDEKMWQGMYDQELSKKMAGSGGVGLADMMMQQLGKNLEDAGRKTLDTGLNRRAPMSIEPAPLMAVATPEPAAKPTAPTADIYSGAAPTVAESVEPESQAPAPVAAKPAEFDSLVSQLETQMQQPEVVITRVTTNTTTLSGPTQVRSGRGMRNPRVAPIHKDLAAQAAAASQMAQPGQATQTAQAGQTSQTGQTSHLGPIGQTAQIGQAAQPMQTGQTAQSSQTGQTPPKHLADGESAAQMKARQDAMMRDAMIRQAMMGVQPGGGAKNAGS